MSNSNHAMLDSANEPERLVFGSLAKAIVFNVDEGRWSQIIQHFARYVQCMVSVRDLRTRMEAGSKALILSSVEACFTNLSICGTKASSR